MQWALPCLAPKKTKFQEGESKVAKVSMTTELKVPAFAPASAPESDAMKAIQGTYEAVSKI